MAVPAQPPGKGAQRRCHLGPAADGSLGGLVDAAHRQRAVGQMLAEPAAGGLGGERAGQAAAISLAPAAEEVGQRGPGVGLGGTPRGLPRGGQVECGQRVGRQARRRAPAGRHAHLGRIHAPLPRGGPAVARAEAAHDTALRILGPGDAGGSAPARHGPVPVIGPARAGFLVAKQMAEARQPGQHFDCRPDAHQQRQAACGQLRPQRRQGRPHKAPVLWMEFGRGQPLGLDQVDREGALEARRLGQRRVVAQAQIALEPDQGRGLRPAARRPLSHGSLGPAGGSARCNTSPRSRSWPRPCASSSAGRSCGRACSAAGICCL